LKKSVVSADAAFPRIGQKAPTFEAVSYSGSLRFPEACAGNWAVLFSHAKAFTPSSSSDIARIYEVGDEFQKNGCRLFDVYSGDYERYLAEFRCLIDQSMAVGLEHGDVHFVLVDDGQRTVARHYGLCCEDTPLHEDVSSFFVIDPSSVIRTILMYHPDNVSRAFDDLLRIVIALRKQDELHGVASLPFHVQNRVALAF
jgi:peroxiredoxin (alkyl hydroperoxide reductase subunit C)